LKCRSSSKNPINPVSFLTDQGNTTFTSRIFFFIPSESFCFKKNQREAFMKFLADMIKNPVVEIKSLSMEDTDELKIASRNFNLDFDGA